VTRCTTGLDDDDDDEEEEEEDELTLRESFFFFFDFPSLFAIMLIANVFETFTE